MSVRKFWGRAVIGGEIRGQTLITIEDQQIVEVRPEPQAPLDCIEVQDLIVPGFIDLHVHGGDGADFMDGTDEAVGQINAFHARYGTTALAATTLSRSRSDLDDAVSAIAR